MAAILSAVFATDAQTYSGQGFAGSVRVSVVGQPVVTTSVLDTGDLSWAGGTVNQSSLGNYTLPGGVLIVGDRTVSTSGVGNSSTTSSSVNSLNVGLLGFSNLVTAGVVTASTSATCPGSVLAANSAVANLVVAGTPITVTGAPNQTVTVDLGSSRILTVVINERITHPRSITANAIRIRLDAPLDLTTADVTIVSARSGINCGTAPVSNVYGGRGTSVRVFQNSLLIPYLSTSVADTGWLPSPGTAPDPAMTSTTAGAGLAPILTTSAAFSSTEGGSPNGTTESSSEVDDLGLNVPNPLFPLLGPENLVTVGADVIQSNTQCQCSLGVPTCSGDSDLVGLTATALGIPVTIPLDFLPNTELIDVNLPALARVRIVANEQSSHHAGTYGAFDVTALRVQIEALAGLVVDTDVRVSKAHSSIACALAPSAAGVSLGGRVTDVNGKAISRATVSITNGSGFDRSVVTNAFGYYSIKEIPAGQFYIVSAGARGYTFSPRTVSLEDSVSGFDLSPDVRKVGKVVPTASETPGKATAADSVMPPSPRRKVSVLVLEPEDAPKYWFLLPRQ